MAVGNASLVRATSPCGRHRTGTSRPIWHHDSRTQEFVSSWDCGCESARVEPSDDQMVTVEVTCCDGRSWTE